MLLRDRRVLEDSMWESTNEGCAHNSEASPVGWLPRCCQRGGFQSWRSSWGDWAPEPWQFLSSTAEHEVMSAPHTMYGSLPTYNLLVIERRVWLELSDAELRGEFLCSNSLRSERPDRHQWPVSKQGYDPAYRIANFGPFSTEQQLIPALQVLIFLHYQFFNFD